MAYKIISKFTAADEGKTYILKQWFSYIDENDEDHTYEPGTPITIIKASSSGGFPEISFDNEPAVLITTYNAWQVEDDTATKDSSAYSNMTTEQLFKNSTLTEIINTYWNSPVYKDYGTTTFNLKELLRLITESMELGDEASYWDENNALCISELPVDIFFKTLNYCCAIDNLNQKVVHTVLNNQKEITVTTNGQVHTLKPIKEIPSKALTPNSNVKLATTVTEVVSAENLPNTYLSSANIQDDINDIPCFLTRIIFEETDPTSNLPSYYNFIYIIKFREILLKVATGEPIEHILVDQYVFSRFKEVPAKGFNLVSLNDISASLLKSNGIRSKQLSNFNIANILKTEL